MRHLRGETITIWKGGALDKWGNPTYSVSLAKARWEDRTELYYGSDGREYRSQSSVGVDVDLAIGDFIAKGDHTTNAEPISGAFEVKDFRKSPNWNYTKFDRWALV